MNETRFDKAFSNFIRGDGERLTTKKFFEVFAEIETRRVDQTIELKAKVVDGKLQGNRVPIVVFGEFVLQLEMVPLIQRLRDGIFRVPLDRSDCRTR